MPPYSTVDSGQAREIEPEEFKYGQEAYNRVMNYNTEDLQEEETVLEDDSATDNGDVVEPDNYNGKALLLPKPGDTISISRGTDLKNETAVVSSWNAWSIEYPGGAFLLKRSVVEARIVDHIDISDQ